LGVATVVSAGVTPTIHDKATLSLAVQRWSSLSELSIVAVAVVIVGYALQRFTRFGRYTMAIGGNEAVAVLSGVRVARFKVLVFTFAGTCYGLAGVMLAASLRSGNLTSSRGYLFSVIAAVVVGGTALTGGRGGVLHSVVGVLLITVINTGMVFAGVSPLMQRAVEGTIIVGVVAAAMWSARGRVRVVK
jgi:ribose transport system permease protein